MRTLWERLGALTLGLGLFTGGAIGVGATNALHPGVSHSAPAPQYREAQAGLSAPARYRFVQQEQRQQPSDPASCAENEKDDAAKGDTGADSNDPKDTDNIQDENGADDAAEANGEQEAANDTDNVQDENGADTATEAAHGAGNLDCGDHGKDATGAQAGGQQAMGRAQQVSFLRARAYFTSQAADGTETETGSGAEQEHGEETGTGGDEATDGILCEQQGEHEGENAGC